MPVVRSQRPSRAVTRTRFMAAFGMVALFVLVAVPSSGAKPIEKTAPTSLNFSIKRAADGGFTIEARFKSPNPHCLEEDRFWEPPTVGLNYTDPSGEGFGTKADGPVIPAVSPFEHSPLIYKSVWRGDAAVTVESSGGPGPRYFESTVGAATGVSGGAWAPGEHPLPGENGISYRTTYKSGGKKISLKCPATKILNVHSEETFPIELSETSRG